MSESPPQANQSGDEIPLCHICSNKSTPFGLGNVLGKYAVHYYRCPSCGFIQTETPYWLEKAYDSVITTSDIGYVERNIRSARLAQGIINTFFNPANRFVDFGGGYGLFVRLMRDAGFDFYRQELFCNNLFARGFDVKEALDNDTSSFELLTAFEVAEHLETPLEGFAEMLKLSNNIFLSTTLIPMSPPQIGSWWYYGLEHGQHISFYTRNALARLAKTFGLHLVTDDQSFHVLSRQRLSNRLFKLLLRRGKALRLLNAFRRRRSLLEDDFTHLTGIKLTAPNASLQ